MGATRIRGKWQLSLSRFEVGRSAFQPLSGGETELVISKATRAGLSGHLAIGKTRVPISGRIKPGSPAVVTFHEEDANGKAVDHGMEALLYIPPWWPTVDYEYDFISGTLVVGRNSALDKSLVGCLVTVAGIQPFE